MYNCFGNDSAPFPATAPQYYQLQILSPFVRSQRQKGARQQEREWHDTLETAALATCGGAIGTQNELVTRSGYMTNQTGSVV